MFVIKKNQIEAFKRAIRKDKQGQMLSQLHAKGFSAKADESRDLIIEDSKGNKTKLVFDEDFRAKKIVKPSGLEYGFTYDDNDKLTKFSFPGNEAIGFGYQGEMLKSIEMQQGSVFINYDEKNRLSEVLSQDGKGYRLTYDISAQLDTLTSRANEVKRFETSIKDNIQIHAQKDSLGKVTRVESDINGEKGDRVVFPDGSQQTTVYDENLEAVVTTLRSGAKVTSYYDGLNPTRVEWEDGNFLDLEMAGEQVKSIENPAGSIRFEYDDAGRDVDRHETGRIHAGGALALSTRNPCLMGWCM